MKLQNKKTGEIRNAVDIDMYTDSVYLKVSDGEFDNETIEYRSLAELNSEWEDYEDEHLYVISAEISCGYECVLKDDYATLCDTAVELGIGFKTEKEAQKAVERLKAWKRLKDKGFKVDLWDYDGGNYQERIKTGRILFRVKDYEENDKDLDLLFRR